MKINHVHAVYFSPTGNAKKVVTTLAQAIADTLGVPMDSYGFTLPESREKVHTYGADDLLVIGTPVYAGRIPNKMLPFVQTHFEGNGALAVPVAVFGNRNFDNGLIELRNELEAHGFHTIAGAGIPTEHVFSDKLATGRPDADDLAQIHAFGIKAAEKIASLTEIPAPIAVRGDDPVGPYYTPLGTDGKPAVFLKAKPVTDPEKCTGCGICATVCPMGSIPADAPDTCTGICIKCQACIKICPAGAKYFDNEPFCPTSRCWSRTIRAEVRRSILFKKYILTNGSCQTGRDTYCIHLFNSCRLIYICSIYTCLQRFCVFIITVFF